MPLHRANESFTFREKKKKISEESSDVILLFFRTEEHVDYCTIGRGWKDHL